MLRKFIVCFLTLLISYTAFAQSKTITDAQGRKIKVDRVVRSVVAFGPGALRLVVYAGGKDMVIGRELQEERVSKELRPYTYALSDIYWELPVFASGGPGKMPDYEKIVSLNPDVIFATALSKKQLDLIQQKTKIPVVGLSYGGLGHTEFDVLNNSLRNIGYIIDKQKRVQNLMNYFARIKKDLHGRSSVGSEASIFLAGVSFKGARGFFSTERNHPVLQLMHIKNVADSVKVSGKAGSHIVVQQESLLKWQPDFIFYDITGLQALNKQYYKTYPFLKMLKANKEGNIYSIMPYNWYNSNVENMLLAGYYMGKILYPDRFADINIEKKAAEIMNNFIGSNPFPQIRERNHVFRRINFGKSGFKFEE